MCLCVAFAQFSLYSSIWDASVGLIVQGVPNEVKFDITNPDKITIAKSYSLRQEFQYIYIRIDFICIFSSHSSSSSHVSYMNTRRSSRVEAKLILNVTRPKPPRQDGLTGGTRLNMNYLIIFTEISFYPETSILSNNSYDKSDKTRI